MTECSEFNINDAFKNLTLPEVKQVQKSESLPYAIGVVNLQHSLNVGAMIRTAVIFGAEKFYIIGKRRYDKRSTVGAHNYIDIQFLEYDVTHPDDQILIMSEISDNYQPVFIEQGGSDISIENFQYYNHKPCFLFGCEASGIPESLIHTAKNYDGKLLSIAQIGVLRSLNVSVSCGIVCHKVAHDLRTMPRSWL